MTLVVLLFSNVGWLAPVLYSFFLSPARRLIDLRDRVRAPSASKMATYVLCLQYIVVEAVWTRDSIQFELTVYVRGFLCLELHAHLQIEFIVPHVT